ncbi:SET domain-containing protein 5, partial [Metarhizium hybridum]
MYEIQDVPGKGKGLVATQAIPKGTRILSEKPIITVPEHMTMSSEQLATLISKQVDALSKNHQQEFLALRNIHTFNDVGQKYLGIIRTNGLPANDGEGGIFLQACRINHACDNNAQKNWNENIKRHTVHALRDIEKGEEITIYYMGADRDRETRIRKLQEQFKFICSCGLCSLPPDQSQESDRRLEQINHLEDLIRKGGLMGILSTPLQKLHYVDQQVRLYNERFPNGRGLARAYLSAAEIAIAHGDLARAQIFVDRALGGRICAEGDDTDDVIELKALAHKVSQDELHGLSMKWKTAVNDVPHGLDPADLEDWLWRREKPRQPGQLAGLRDRTTFPAFLGLPHDESYYFDDPNELAGHSRRNWCFLAEIQHVTAFNRLHFEIKDVQGETLPLFFYTDSRGMELDRALVKEGFTVAILQAKQHSFMFDRPGIRHEQPSRIKIFPVSLDKLMALSDRIQQFSDCQVARWNKNGHKADCKLLKDEDLRSLFTNDWDKFESGIQFPLSK